VNLTLFATHPTATLYSPTREPTQDKRSKLQGDTHILHTLCQPICQRYGMRIPLWPVAKSHLTTCNSSGQSWEMKAALLPHPKRAQRLGVICANVVAFHRLNFSRASATRRRCSKMGNGL
jgi:hypothetical protein